MRNPNLRVIGCAAVVLVAALGLGCSDDGDVTAPDPGLTGEAALFWTGAFLDADTGEGGRLNLSLDRDRDALTGWLFVEYAEAGFRLRYPLVGTATATNLDVHLDRTDVDFQFDLRITATGWDGDTLVGTLSHSTLPLTADLEARAVPRHQLSASSWQAHDMAPTGIVHAWGELWLSWWGWGWYRLTEDGEVVGPVQVERYPDLYWTAHVDVAWDGQLIYGDYPVTVNDGDSITNVSDLIGFDAQGEVQAVIRLSHRVGGVACDDDRFWTIESEGRALRRVDEAGNVEMAVTLESNDVIHLDVVDGRFFSQGWYLPHIYELDVAGTLVAVYDYPQWLGVVIPRGITHDADGDLWCGVGLTSGGHGLLELELPEVGTE